MVSEATRRDGEPPQSWIGELEWLISILESRGLFHAAHSAAWLSAHTTYVASIEDSYMSPLHDYRVSEERRDLEVSFVVRSVNCDGKSLRLRGLELRA